MDGHDSVEFFRIPSALTGRSAFESNDTLPLCLCDTWQKRLLGTAAMVSFIGGGAYVSTRNPGTVR